MEENIQIINQNANNLNGVLNNSYKINENTNAEKFDLNEHLFKYLSKMNLYQDDKESSNQNYCLECKEFFDNESGSEHSDHELISNKKDLLNLNVLDTLFDNLEEKYLKIFTEDASEYYEKLRIEIEKSIENHVNNLNILKNAKTNELNIILSNYKLNFQKIKKDLFEMKYKLTEYYKKNDAFLNLNNKNIYSNKRNNDLSLKNQNVNMGQIITKVNSNNNYTDGNRNNILNSSAKVNNTLNNTLNASNINPLNSNNINKRQKNNYFDNNILNDLMYLINLDLNKTINLTENKIEAHLNKEKKQIFSQSDVIKSIFEDFEEKIKKFQDDFRKNYLELTKEQNNKKIIFPDFTQSLNLKLKKYAEILDNLNFTLVDLRNPKSYKKIESLIGNMENDIVYRISQRNTNFLNGNKNYFPESCHEMEFKKIVDNLDDIDNLDYDYKLNSKEKINKTPDELLDFVSSHKGLLSVKNKENPELKNKFNLLSYNSNDIKSRSDNKAETNHVGNNKQINKLNSEFLFDNEEDTKINHLNKVKEIQKNRKKNLSLNIEKINIPSIENPLKMNHNYNSSTSKLNVNPYDSYNNFSILNNSSTNKSMSFWKNKEDLLKKFLILSLMGTYEEIQEIAEENENQDNNCSKIEKIIQNNSFYSNTNDPVVAKTIENTNEILIYDKKSFSITKHKVNMKKEIHGIEIFLDGSRSILAMDKIFIIGGRDALQQYSLCLEYDYKLRYIKKIPNMISVRAYHTLIFNQQNLKILAIGGESNKTCEEYDLYKQTWNALPDLNVPRAYINCYLNKNKNMIYALFGLKGEITKDNFTDSVEILDLEKKEKGWVKIDYINKCDINLKTKYVHVFPIESDKLLIVGNCYSRYNHKTFAVYDLKIDNISKIDSRIMLEIRRKSKYDPALKKLLSDINKSLN